MFSSKYGKCQSGSISATPSAEMNSVEMTFAIAVIPSSRVVSVGGPAQHPNLIARLRTPDPHTASVVRLGSGPTAVTARSAADGRCGRGGGVASDHGPG